MKLLTKNIEKQLPPLYSQSKNLDPIVYAKFFSPVSNWTWFVTEGSFVCSCCKCFDCEGCNGASKDSYMFFGLVVGFEKELGYFDLQELEQVKLPYGLGIERDLSFKPTKLSQIKEMIS